MRVGSSERRMRRLSAGSVSIVLAGLVLAALTLTVAVGAKGQAAPQATAPTDDDKPKKTFVKVCGECHEIERAFESRRTRYDWEDLVLKMVTDKGAKGTDEELNLVVAYGLSQAGIANVNESEASDIQLALKLTPAEADAIVSFRKAHGPYKDFDALKTCPGVDAAKLDASKIGIRF